MKLNKQAAEFAMAAKGWSGIDLANEMGVSKQVVYKYLGGDSCRPKMAKQFADALDVPVLDLFDWKPDTQTNDPPGSE